MRVPISWLQEYVALDLSGAGPRVTGPGETASTEITETSAREVARVLTAVGLEVETVEPAGHDISGVVIAQVREIEELTEFKKPIRYCRVLAGEGQERQVICGAVNFAVGDLVAFALPGSTLPGGVSIGARKAYGRTSEGMICAADELGIGEDHSGILVLPQDAPLGGDFAEYAGLRDWVLDIAVTPDRGYALSIRGVARDLAIPISPDVHKSLE